MIQGAEDPNCNVLQSEQGEVDVGSGLQLMKIGYLLKEKAMLEVQIHEIRLNNQLLRQVNQQIVINPDPNLANLLARNAELQNMVMATNQENRKLQADIFLAHQVCLENEKEQREIFMNYQSKILQLRKAIQVKQSNIQDLEARLAEQHWVALRASKLEFFEQVDDLCRELKEATASNKKLTAQYQALARDNKAKTERLQKIQKLTARRCSYVEFRNLMDEQRRQSMPKQMSKFNCLLGRQSTGSPSDIKLNQKSTCQDRLIPKQLNSLGEMGENSHACNLNTLVLHRIIRQKLHEIRKLADRVRNLEVNLSKLQAENKKLARSNEIYQNSRRLVAQKCGQFQSVCRTLFDYVGRRAPFANPPPHKDDGWRRSDRQGREARKLGNQAQINRLEKQEWMGVKKWIEDTCRQPVWPLKLRRSHSCLLDYLVAPAGHDHGPKSSQPHEQEFSIHLHLGQQDLGQGRIKMSGKSAMEREKSAIQDVFGAVLQDI